MRAASFLRDQSGSSAAEFALMLPMLMALLYAGFEGGNLIWTQHKLVEGVREGVRLAGRMDINDVCGGDATALANAKAQVGLLTRTGQLANPNAKPRVGGWTANQVQVDFACNAFMSSGIYTELGNTLGPNGPIVTVRAAGVIYPSLFAGLGQIKRIPLTASAKSPVTGL